MVIFKKKDFIHVYYQQSDRLVNMETVVTLRLYLPYCFTGFIHLHLAELVLQKV